MKLKTRKDYRVRRHRRVRRKVHGTAACPRLAIMVSTQHIYAQLIDDDAGVTLASATTRGAEAGKNVAGARTLGLQIAETAKSMDVARFVVDRGGFTFTGRVKSVVDGALEGGLTNKKEEK
jgi:large subunit ribosomal protein L18